MSRHSLLSLVVSLIAVNCTAVQGPQDVDSDPEWDFSGGNFSVLLGINLLDDEDTWAPIDEQATYGLQLDIGDPDAFLRWDVGLNYITDDSVGSGGFGTFGLEADTWEATLGALTVFDLGRSPVHPYLGLGASLVHTEAKLSSGGTVLRDSDFSLGGYLRAGVRFEFRRRQFVGLDLRQRIGTDLSLGGIDTDLDGTVISLVFGYAF
ncbi:MAG: outer membrane beta-barrel protein [Planctomycetota bacterium]